MAPREFYEQIASTQGRAIELARAGGAEGACVVARTQSAGRGRSDHVWASPPGGLYLSVVLRDSERASGLFALLLGARLADALARAYHVPLRVKWPNDLFVVRPGVPPRKLGGILIDRVLVPDGTVLVAGIGVNVSAPPSAYPTELRGFVASLTEIASPPPSLDEVERIVLEGAIDAARTAADPAQRAETLAACRAALYGIGHHAVVDGVPQGIIRGLAEDGALLVEHGPDLVSIRAGDLRVEGAA